MPQPRDPRFEQFLASLDPSLDRQHRPALVQFTEEARRETPLALAGAHLRLAHYFYRQFLSSRQPSCIEAARVQCALARQHSYIPDPACMRPGTALRAEADVLLGHVTLQWLEVEPGPDRSYRLEAQRIVFDDFLKAAKDVRQQPFEPILPELEWPCDPIAGWQDWPLLGCFLAQIETETATRWTIQAVTSTGGTLQSLLQAQGCPPENDTLLNLLARAKIWATQIAAAGSDPTAQSRIQPPGWNAIGVLIGALPGDARLPLALAYRTWVQAQQQEQQQRPAAPEASPEAPDPDAPDPARPRQRG